MIVDKIGVQAETCKERIKLPMRDYFEQLQTCYRGFYIDRPAGNNAFSYRQRRQRRIYVPPLRRGDVPDLAPGQEIVFSEVEEGVERNLCGLQSLLCLQKAGKTFFIFDNHNHAFSFWVYGLHRGVFPAGLPLLHVDQHSDMREPIRYLIPGPEGKITLAQACDYANFELNVGNFIRPALALGIFSEMRLVDSSSAFERRYDAPYVLDIDVDIFAPEMDYIDPAYKLSKIREYIRGADFITIATSPFFIDQALALKVVRALLDF